MVMVVENGTGLTNADAFISVADCEAYLTPRGFTAFSLLTNEQKEAAIINASEFISSAFGWIGARKNQEQSLAWPRVAVIGDGVYVPPNIPRAVAIAVARVANTASLGNELFAAVTGGDLVTRVQAGSVSVDFSEMSARVTAAGRASMPWLRDWLGYLSTGGPDDPTTDSMTAVQVERV